MVDDGMAAKIEELIGLLGQEDERGARGLLAHAMGQLESGSPERRRRCFEEAVQRLEQPWPRTGAMLALMCGALVEAGEPVEPLARSLLAPLRAVLRAARPFVEAVRALPQVEETDEAVELGFRCVRRAELNAVVERDPAASEAFRSLELWYLPVVAAWTRATSYLVAAKRDAGFVEDLEALGRAGGAYWISILLGASMETPFVILVPELGEAYGVRLAGVCDMAQLSVLISRPLASLLARLGAPAVASDEMLQVMSGQGPQQIGESFAAQFHFYDWRSLNPATGLPEPGRFTWLAPGGFGDHSLPGDFQPEAVAPLHGTRVLLLVGPQAPNVFRVTRELGGSRSFCGLEARVYDVQQLTPEDARGWSDAVRVALSS